MGAFLLRRLLVEDSHGQCLLTANLAEAAKVVSQRQAPDCPSLPRTMTVIAARAPGGPEVLVPEERPLPALADREILVRVRAAGVNRPDVMQRQGKYPPPPGASDVIGLEIAGEVAALGHGASPLQARRRGDGACPGRRLRRVLQGPRNQRAARCRRAFPSSRRPQSPRRSSPSGRTSSARAARRRRDGADPRRFLRHRHHRDPARQGVRRAASSSPPAARKNAPPA